MTNVRRASLWVLLSALASVMSALAQPPSAEPAPAPAASPPAHISLVEGQAFIDREGRSEPAADNVPLVDGDRLRTEQGRVEVILADGSALYVDLDTTLDILSNDLVRLLQGRVYIVVLGARDPSRAMRYQVDAPVASAQTNGPGEYRFSVVDTARGKEAELAVFRGDATLANDLGSVGVRAGERALAGEGLAPGAPQYFNSARWDAFDRWSANRRDARLGTVSVRYLPNDLEPYSAAFDRYGTWRYEQPYGYVWAPAVTADWRPYSTGHWRPYDAYGSFWVGSDPWAWPTHHYGRWGFSGGFGWYWIPGRVWGPAWVYWAVATDYLSWCPLGWNDYPVFGRWGVRGVYAGGYDSWHGWTVMPRHHFGRSIPVGRVAIDPRMLGPGGRSAFVAQRRAPYAGRAVPRAYGGGTAVPRGLGGTPGAAVSRGMLSPRSPGSNGPAARYRTVGDADAAARFFRAGARSTGPSAVSRWPDSGNPSMRSPADPGSPRFEAPGMSYPRRSVPGAVPRTDVPDSAGRGLPGRYGAIAPRGGGSAEPVIRRGPDRPDSSVPFTTMPERRVMPQPDRQDWQSPGRGRGNDVPRNVPAGGWSAPAERARPRGYDSPSAQTYGSRPGAPAERARPRGYDRPSAQTYGSRPGASAPAARPGPPRDSGRPSGSAPRYNPGSAQPRSSGGGAPPQHRRRGGSPD